MKIINRLKASICLSLMLILMLPIVSFGENNTNTISDHLEYKALKEIEEDKLKSEYLSIALEIIEKEYDINKGELALKTDELNALYEYIENSYKLGLSKEEFKSNLIQEIEMEIEVKEEPTAITKPFFKYFILLSLTTVAVCISWNFIIFKVNEIKKKI